uniref:G-type lectin S-receptor-like serine/threonine-protein kinase At4g27290 n=1 Tax=Erigeron canadensis TaxID=72917 RepID=UPI001CB945A5|nr:G-type lectin S-receptor-like serine/threonine-protein kinase At4g27290 [Erigeron canadensis]
MADTYNLKTYKPSMQWLCSLLLSILFSMLPLTASENRITITNSITRNQTIISAGGNFALGFFTPSNSNSSYLGIWYNTISKPTIIWVANRASPIHKSLPPLFCLSEDGNLVLFGGKKVVWTTNVSASNSADAVLLDNGNLVLRHDKDGEVWHSFDQPTDTFVPEMKISSNIRTGQETRLTSWENDEDPRPGIFSIGIDPYRHQFYVWKQDKPYWRSHVYATTYSFASPLIKYDKGFSTYLSFVVEEDEVYLVSSVSTNSVRTRFTLVPDGRIQLLVWVQTAWVVLWQAPLATCDFYGYCGPFTICHKNKSYPVCTCMTGFEPKSRNEWNVGNWTGGCVRNTELRCDNGDRFLKFEGMKLPDHSVTVINKTKSVSDCELECFRNCSCTAYAYENVTYEGTKFCLNWFRELVDTTDNDTLGYNLYVRVHNSKTDDSQEHNSTHIRKGVIAVAAAIVSIGFIICSVFGYYLRRERLIRKERVKKELLGFDSMSSTSVGSQSNTELVSFSLRSVLAATGSFSVKNKLGEGGFGPVYKGSLPGNREVAVKRLSTRSSQGREEFMNELKLIAKLQHTNLVRLLGCCVEEDEQILMYEYMPNRSLDKFLFDPSKSVNLDWSKRFKIIEGIAQGLLYLHKYSRLKVIHRDLKASNVLLDQMMTPKISDFGLARIFEMNQIEDKTNRVVGTYGYMAPEYALHGRYSERSDVYSFGVLLLEIVTGKRNTGSDCMEDNLTVSEWAWEHWMNGRGLELIDPSMTDVSNPLLAVKCINVGLLCVQENMNDRPTMSEVVVMLSNETATISLPQKPPFTIHRSSNISCRYSNNEVTMSHVDPR